ncbi:MAG: hypothetical protein ACOYML_03605 [Microthrixaceae bacterium]
MASATEHAAGGSFPHATTTGPASDPAAAGAPDPASSTAAPAAGARDVVDRDAAERILRRAVELSEQVDADVDGVRIGALFHAADQLGMEPNDLRRALAEEQLGLLAQPSRRSDRILGADQVVVARVVPGAPDEVLERLDLWMRQARVLRRVRRDTHQAVYARRGDPAAVVQRSIRALHGSERLARVRRLGVAVVAVGEAETLVSLRVDTSASRAVAAASGLTVAASGVVTAGLTAVTWVPWAWLGVPVAAAGGVGVMAARKGYVADVDDDLEAVLDQLAGGGRPVSLFDAVAARVVRPRRPAADPVR